MCSHKERIIAALQRCVACDNLAGFTFIDKYYSRQSWQYSSCQRLTHILAGKMQLEVGLGRSMQLLEYPAGQTLVMRPYSRTLCRWGSSYESLGLVLAPEYLRVIHTSYEAGQEPPQGPGAFFHLCDSLRLCTLNAINTLCSLRAKDVSHEQGRALWRLVLQLLLSDLRNSKAIPQGRPYHLWLEIVDFLENSVKESVSRTDVASKFRISDSYVSRLFREYSGHSFVEYLGEKRLMLARNLLRDSAMSVKEIASLCGYNSSSYFIRHFKARFKTTPGSMRRYDSKASGGAASLDAGQEALGA